MSIKEELVNLLSPLLISENYELVELQYHREGDSSVLRVFVDKTGGITLDDCAKLSEKIGRYLDEKDIIPQRYVLEVSSPGLNRPLKKESDFQKFTGRLVKINVFAPVEGERHFLGRIVEVEDGKVKLSISEQKNISISLENIASARLEVEI
ncbi:MAG TPA: ribosome maturation factor RimP [Elusimicrobia bacterium]|jgi:ribosome maturation factor RimP|nr:ribosome maturation factor RimP [Elusimicrobiota bacterium]